MTKQKISNINTGGGAFISGSVNTGGGKFVGRDDHSQNDANETNVKHLFNSIYSEIDKHPDLQKEDKADLKQEIAELQQELEKKDSANEGFLVRRLRNIRRMAPDILDVTLAVITSPAAGFGLIAKKVAEKIKAS